MFSCFCVKVKRMGEEHLCLIQSSSPGPLSKGCVVFQYITQLCAWKLSSALQELPCCSVPTTGLKQGPVKAIHLFFPTLSLLVYGKASRANRFLPLPCMCANRQIGSISKILNAYCDLFIFLSASRSLCLWELFSLWYFQMWFSEAWAASPGRCSIPCGLSLCQRSTDTWVCSYDVFLCLTNLTGSSRRYFFFFNGRQFRPLLNCK